MLLPKYMRKYISSDFAVTDASAGRDPDYTEHAVVGIGSDDVAYVVDWWSGQKTADVWIEALIDLVDKHKPDCWFGESGVIRRAVEPLMTRMVQDRRVWFRQEWVTSVADKTVRARSLQAWSSMGKVVFPRTTWADRVIDQLVAFPQGNHDDAVDALSLLFMAIDMAHPAVVPSSEQKTLDRYRLRQTQDQGHSAWRTK
ncbi:MAG: hypothetical protein A2Y75_01620 [Candidatus Solincola sediminis]|uniref:Terminase large subunit gp17-like C-terminal domain-containing protein n=1 Tax=Candidatus Solincola sediminis TaxID=1797199 RepID=A0A1F2WNL2_9ACTN|nr:MAG: hypothetical protein A2Y75_01620 [Candidatus Solincola sediminis]